jgi:aspartokinase
MATSLAPDWQAARTRMAACAPSMTLEGGLASASVVGVDQAVQVSAALTALTAADVLPASVAQAGTRLDALVAEEHLDRAVRALHARFVVDA